MENRRRMMNSRALGVAVANFAGCVSRISDECFDRSWVPTGRQPGTVARLWPSKWLCGSEGELDEI